MSINLKSSGKLTFLKKISIFKGLTDDQLKIFSEICKEKSIKQDEIIMREGEPGSTMYLFVEGEVEFSNSATLKIPKKGFEKSESIGGKLNAKFVPFFGDMALFEDAPRSATIKAITDVNLYEVKKDDFERVCGEDCTMGYIIMKNIIPVIANRLRNTNENIKKLTTILTIVLSKKK